jgi:hypothetical protein
VINTVYIIFKGSMPKPWRRCEAAYKAQSDLQIANYKLQILNCGLMQGCRNTDLFTMNNKIGTVNLRIILFKVIFTPDNW